MDARVEEIIAEVKARESHWAPHLARRREIDYLISGRWEHVFPDDVTGDDMPMVANIFRVNTEDIGRLFAEQVPSQRCDRATDRDLARTEDREKVLLAYDNLSRTWDQSEWWGQDMAAVGFAAIKVWPRMSTPIERRFPLFERVDPRDILPEITWKPHRPTDSVIIDTTDSVDRLASWFPEQMAALMERIIAYKTRSATIYGAAEPTSADYGIPTELRVIDLYSSKKICRVVMFDDDVYVDGEVLVEIPNVIDCCPIQLAYRPSWVREPYGQMDDAKGIVRTENRYFQVLLDYFVEMVYGGKLVWNVKNPTDKGPGVRYYALGPDARMESVAPEIPSNIALSMLAQLESEARTTSIAPRSREGDVQLNKASAAFLERAQGQLVSVVKSLSRSFAAAKERANEVAFAMDEEFCDAMKEVNGVARGRRYRLRYRPTELIRGDHQNRVSYGLRGGIDQPTWNVLQLQKQTTGNLSRESFMEEDPAIEDVEAELQRLRRQVFEESLLAMLAEPTTDPATKLKIIAGFRDSADVEEVAEMALASQAPPALAGAPGAALPVAGAPGAGGAPPAPLPPIASIRSLR